MSVNKKTNISIDTLSADIIKALENGIEEICVKVEADAVLGVHVDTATLKRSITYNVENDGGNIKGSVGSYGVDYAVYEDMKHGWLSDAVDSNKAQMNTIIEKHLKGVK